MTRKELFVFAYHREWVGVCIYVFDTHNHALGGGHCGCRRERSCECLSDGGAHTNKRAPIVFSQILADCAVWHQRVAQLAPSHRSLAKSPTAKRPIEDLIECQIYTLGEIMKFALLRVALRRIQIARTIKVAAPSGARERLKRIGIVSCAVHLNL
jgi:hypothetical protein